MSEIDPDLLRSLAALLEAGAAASGGLTGAQPAGPGPKVEQPERFMERLERLEMRANGL